ncbi:hypothetical protein PF008_g4306 [Phytophthora fragariae]|uniref:RxLR effector protein n=1 Tax=Phytophthora fragariae TaxID=53985 RepID=A0A6G0SC91_9STRA|nr:hypothetical protein PF008_g4306 [Phytophthora fragariae]
MVFIWAVVVVLLQGGCGVTRVGSILSSYGQAAFRDTFYRKRLTPSNGYLPQREVGGRTGRYNSIQNHLCFGWDASCL